MSDNQNIFQGSESAFFSESSLSLDRIENIEFNDFKMITFSLGGRDYGIDIMYVKEISRVNEFTYVPNAPNYVRGVYNLRGEIISVMDLRTLFNVSKMTAKDGMDDLMVLKGDDFMIGVIVDSIRRVVGVSSSKIQPPHPIFEEINISFMKGLVESDNKLFIILDVEKILGSGKTIETILEEKTEEPEEAKLLYRPVLPGMGLVKNEQIEVETVSAQELGVSQPTSTSKAEKVSPQADAAAENPSVLDKGNRVQLLEKLTSNFHFYQSKVNKKWFDTEFHNVAHEVEINAETFISSFFSRSTNELWTEVMISELLTLLPQEKVSSFYAMNAGCSEGYETYSITAALNVHLRIALIRVWAADTDLISISMAPTLSFEESVIPISMQEFISETQNGKKIKKNISEQISFEYHDVLHEDTYPPMDLVVARDFLSFIEPDNLDAAIDKLVSKMKIGALLIIGDNEEISHPELKRLENNLFSCYNKV